MSSHRKKNVGFSPNEIIRLKQAMNEISRSREGQLDSLSGLQKDLLAIRMLQDSGGDVMPLGKARKIRFQDSLSYDDIMRLKKLESLFGRDFVSKRYGA